MNTEEIVPLPYERVNNKLIVFLLIFVNRVREILRGLFYKGLSRVFSFHTPKTQKARQNN